MVVVVVVLQGFPAEFAMYLNYCRGLKFEEAPDYMYLRQLYRILFRTLNHQYDYTFDWTLLKQNVGQQSAVPMSAGATALPGTAPPQTTSARHKQRTQREYYGQWLVSQVQQGGGGKGGASKKKPNGDGQGWATFSHLDWLSQGYTFNRVKRHF